MSLLKKVSRLTNQSVPGKVSTDTPLKGHSSKYLVRNRLSCLFLVGACQYMFRQEHTDWSALVSLIVSESHTYRTWRRG